MPRPRGRYSRSEPLKEVSITLPRALLERVDLHLIDPLSGKPAYGARSSLVEQLLREWLGRFQEQSHVTES